MTVEMDEQDKKNLAEVRIRRLKEDINRQSLRPPFADQMEPVALPIKLSPQEVELYAALREYRKHGHAGPRPGVGRRTLAGPVHLLAAHQAAAVLPLRLRPDVVAAPGGRSPRTTRPPCSTWPVSRRSGPRSRPAATTRGPRWRRTRPATAGPGSAAGAETVEDLQRRVNAGPGEARLRPQDRRRRRQAGRPGPKSDSKTEALVAWIKKNLFAGGKLRDDERLIVFTEYKETLFYLEQRLLQEGFDKNTLRLLYGGMNADEFEAVKGEFEDPTAAGAAAPGDRRRLRRHQHAGVRAGWIIHYDIPWSPSRLQQRNGRVSRHGQVRDVYVHYFRCDEEEDMDFLFRVAEKVEQVRQDLGSVERIFDAAIQRHFQGKTTSIEQVGLFVEPEIARSPERQELGHSPGPTRSPT